MENALFDAGGGVDGTLRTTPSRKYPRMRGKRGTPSGPGRPQPPPALLLNPLQLSKQSQSNKSNSRPPSPDAGEFTRTMMEMSPVSIRKKDGSSQDSSDGGKEVALSVLGGELDGKARVPVAKPIPVTVSQHTASTSKDDDDGDSVATTSSSSSSSSESQDDGTDVFGGPLSPSTAARHNSSQNSKVKQPVISRAIDGGVGERKTMENSDDEEDDDDMVGAGLPLSSKFSKLKDEVMVRKVNVEAEEKDAFGGVGVGLLSNPHNTTPHRGSQHITPAPGIDSGGGGGGVRFAPDTVFTPSSELASPGIREHSAVKYRAPTDRPALLSSNNSTVTAPDVEDTLRRVAVVIYQHILRGERVVRSVDSKSVNTGPSKHSPVTMLSAHRPGSHAAHKPIDISVSTPKREDLNITIKASQQTGNLGVKKGLKVALPDTPTRDLSRLTPDAATNTAALDEELYVRPKWKYRYIRSPFAGPGAVYAVERLDNVYSLPTTKEVYDFARELFLKAQLGAECIIVSLVYIERLMETAGVVLLINNWRTVLLCALLLASKVWQDLSSWNVEFSLVYPQYTLDAINRLERTFVTQLQYKLYISGSVYAKYYFALRSMSEQPNFRQRYMVMISVGPSVKRIEESSNVLKNQLYSRSV